MSLTRRTFPQIGEVYDILTLLSGLVGQVTIFLSIHPGGSISFKDNPVCNPSVFLCLDAQHFKSIHTVYFSGCLQWKTLSPRCCNIPQRIRLQSQEQSASLLPGGPINAGFRPLVKLGGEAQHSRGLITQTQPENYNMVEKTSLILNGLSARVFL